MPKPETPWLDKLRRLSIKIWRYRKDIDPRQMLHIGPLAEDWRNVMQIGDGATIDQIDQIGVLMVAVKELAARVEFLEKEIENGGSDVRSTAANGRHQEVDAGSAAASAANSGRNGR